MTLPMIYLILTIVGIIFLAISIFTDFLGNWALVIALLCICGAMWANFFSNRQSKKEKEKEKQNSYKFKTNHTKKRKR